MATPPSAWDRVQDYAGRVETVVEWPTDDAAAVLGVETVWLAGMLLSVKLLTVGLYKEFFAEPRRRR